MISRYWAYTVKYVPRQSLPADLLGERVHNDFLEHKKQKGEEYEAQCLDESADPEFPSPEDVISHINGLFPNIPKEVLIDKRLISKEEFDAWEAERTRFAKEEGAYIRGERATAPEW